MKGIEIVLSTLVSFSAFFKITGSSKSSSESLESAMMDDKDSDFDILRLGIGLSLLSNVL